MSASSAPLLLTHVSDGDSLPELTHEVTPTTVVLGALASRDWRPMHHDYKFATERNGVADIFLNTPNQAAWFERYITDWTGATGRIGRMKFRMRDSVFPGDLMTFRATVTGTETDGHGCGWVSLDVSLWVDDRICSSCDVRVAIPVEPGDNPWMRRGPNWEPVGSRAR
jgi:acyl dehydratase